MLLLCSIVSGLASFADYHTDVACRLWLRLTKMSEDRLIQKIFSEAHRWACMWHKNWIATTLDILNKDRTELDLNPTYTLNHNPDILQYT